LTSIMVKIAFVVTVLGLIVAVLARGNIQRSLLYYPGHYTIDEVRHYAAANDLRLWPDDNAGYYGIVSRKGPAGSEGTVVVCHGNAGAAVDRSYYIAALEGRGFRVVLIEYPGYGGRPGELGEESFIADARRAALRAQQEFGGPLYVWGESLGCGVASALAADAELRPRGVVLITPWDSLANEAKVHYPWLPVRLLLHDTYDNAANLAHYAGPVAVIMAGRDEIIPNRLTEQLYRALSQPKRLWTLADAGHNDWPRHPGAAWWDEVLEFMSAGG